MSNISSIYLCMCVKLDLCSANKSIFWSGVLERIERKFCGFRMNFGLIVFGVLLLLLMMMYGMWWSSTGGIDTSML